jgi:hypothetical protein
VVALALYCTNPQNPFSNPKSAKIVADSSLTSLKDSVQAFTTIPCTVSLYLPDLFDSFFVVRRIGTGTDSVIASGTVSSSQVAFSLPVTYPGIYTVNIRIVKTDKTVDSLTRTFTVYAPYSLQVGFILPQKDSLLFHREYACSCSVTHPELADSLVARLIYAGADTVLIRTKAAPVLAFRFTVPVIGAFSIRINVPLLGGGQDSLTKPFTGYRILAPAASSFRMFTPPDSFKFTFEVTDLDSSLWGGYTWTGATTNNSQQTIFPPKNLNRSTIVRTIKILGDSMVQKFPDTIVCSAVAIYPDSELSGVAVCTLFVNDTAKPQIHLLLPKDTVNPLSSPIIIRALVTDIVGIDSVRFDTSVMVFSKDTALFVASHLDSGRHAASITAIDKAGNSGRLDFSFNVLGQKFAPPQIRDLSKATSEGLPFAPILLDTYVIVSDTSIKDAVTYAKDSLSWVITDSSGTSLTVLPTHLFTIPFPADSAFFGTFNLTFKLLNKNLTTLYDTKQPSFFVTQANFPPVITIPSDQCFKALQTDTIYLDTVTTAHDPNNTLSSLSWSFSKGNHFKVDSVYSSRFLGKVAESSGLPIVNPIRPLFFFTRHIVINAISAADTSFYGTDSLNFTVKDPGGLVASKKIYFTRTKTFCLFHL